MHRRDTTAAVEGNDVVARIRDNHLQMFAQAEHQRGATPRGLGIGLNLVRRLVELHGGTVSATNDGRGAGSEFVVRLPRLN